MPPNLIAFVHIKKTAGKTVKHIMRRELGIRHCDVKRWRQTDHCLDAAGLRRLRRVYPGLISIAGHSIKAYSDLKQAEPKLAYYTFLRDPVRRTVSQYQYRVKMGRSRPGSFEQWIRDPANRDLQVQTLANGRDRDRALEILEHDIAFVGLMEHLDESLALMRPALNLPDIDLSPDRVNAAGDNTLRDKLLGDPHSLELLQKANELDLQLYEYAKNVIYPRQRARFPEAIRDVQTRPGNGHGQRRSVQYFLNGAYRHLVYKPIVWTYRTTARG
jgi:hypothetical protein